jgi:hypothetical protein
MDYGKAMLLLFDVFIQIQLQQQQQHQQQDLQPSNHCAFGRNNATIREASSYKELQ